MSLGARDFNPGLGAGRFHPFVDARGNAVPTLYGGADFETAVFETLLRDLYPGSMIARSELGGYARSIIAPRRDLRLINLYPSGLKRLGVSARHLLQGGASTYSTTVQWAQALHQASGADGMIWRSRQLPGHDALTLWGDRLVRGDLRTIADATSLRTPTLCDRTILLAINRDIIVDPND
jgi:hypothetical protein